MVPVLASDRAVRALATLAVAAVAVFALGAVFGLAPLIAAGPALFGVEYGLYLVATDPELDLTAPLLAALVLLAAELAFGAVEPRVRPSQLLELARSAGAPLATAAGGLVAAVVVVVAAGAEAASGLAVELLGIGAAVAALALVALLARAR